MKWLGACEGGGRAIPSAWEKGPRSWQGSAHWVFEEDFELRQFVFWKRTNAIKVPGKFTLLKRQWLYISFAVEKRIMRGRSV